LPSIAAIPQCASVAAKIAAFAGEGCRARAQLRAVRVGGEFHIVPVLSWPHDGWNYHETDVFGVAYDQFNLTHTVNELRFAQHASAAPLDGITFVQDERKPWKTIYTADVLELKAERRAGEAGSELEVEVKVDGNWKSRWK
jgi:hypothetical protein